MSTAKTIDQQSPGSAKMLRAMVGIGVICALLIVITYEQTLPRIERLRAEALEQAIFNVIPGITKTKKFERTNDGSFKEASDDSKAQLVYAGYDVNDQLLGIAVEAAGQGYADIIRILYGYNPSTEKIVGFYVLESKETPGLGDKIEKDNTFLSNFTALDVTLTDNFSAIKNSIITVKRGEKKNNWEVDGITGATISSRAIGNIINSSANELVPLLYSNKEVFVLRKEDTKNE